MITDKLYSVKSAAPYLGITQSTLYDYLKEPAYEAVLQPVRIGGKVFIRESVINEVIKNGLPRSNTKSIVSRKKRETYHKPKQVVRPWQKSSEKV